MICPNLIDPAAKNLLQIWGLPNQPGAPFTNINNWRGNVSKAGNMHEFIARGDHYVSDRQRLFLRYTLAKVDTPAPDVFNNRTIFVSTAQYLHTHQVVFNESYSFSPTMVADVALSYMRNDYGVRPPSLGFDLGTLAPGWAPLNNQVSFRTLPAVSVSGYSAAAASGQAITDATDDWNLAPNFSLVKGRHTIKFGGDFRLARFAYIQLKTGAIHRPEQERC